MESGNLQHLLPDRALRHVGSSDHDRHHQAQGIGQQMPLAPLSGLRCVMASV
jgi:hypothetical protein